MNENISHESPLKNRSTLATVLFVILAPTLVCGTLTYHSFTWFIKQMVMLSGAENNVPLVGMAGLGFQFISLLAIIGLLWAFTKDERYRPVYAGWLGAAAIALPAMLLRPLGPNNDQIGSLLQIFIALSGAGIVMLVRRKKPIWRPGIIPAGLLVAAIGIAPLAVYGAFGSLADTFLHLLAGLSFGLLAATLMSVSTENGFLDGLGIGVLLALLGSAFGYDGGQLILLGILPPFAFALSALMPSFAATAITTGLLAGAGLALFDPTELTIALGDLVMYVILALFIVLILGWLTGAAIWITRMALRGSPWAKPLAGIGAAAAWLTLVVIYLFSGNPGFYGDRLFVILKDQADISEVAAIKDREQRLTEAYTRLTGHAEASQADLQGTLDTFQVGYTPYYLVNALEVEGGTLMRLYLMTRSEVDRVIPSPRLRPVPETDTVSGEFTSVEENPGWNIKMIGADRVWEEFGVRGQGIVVGQSDSGAEATHPALSAQYRGLQNGDDYNWFDPWEGTTSPIDKGGHGTHTLGTILGTNGIGVAPEATWMACTNLARNLANPALYLDCMQFMLAPFPQGGDPFTDGDPTRAAHVLNNSWGCPQIEGCDPTSLQTAVEHLRAAGIFVVASAGNDGPECGTVQSPISLYEAVFSVGAIDQFGDMAEFSSRGPVTADESGRMKPDISAPGVDIFSALPDGTYGVNSGTSMAGPHVAGVVALLWSANPDLIGDIDGTEQILIETVDRYTGSMEEGCFQGGTPNAAYGYGVVNAYEAVKKALGR